MTMMNYLYFALFCFSCVSVVAQNNDFSGTQSNLNGHWKLVDTKMVDDVPFLNIPPPEEEPLRMVSEDSPWDHYTGFDLVFENDSMYKMHYPIEALASVRFFLDTGYLHISTGKKLTAYPAQLVNDTLLLYTPVSSDPGYFKETFVRTHFNDSILDVMKTYGVNYPELAGTWMLVREKDYDYGTHYELEFPHKLPDSMVFSRKQMINALKQSKTVLIRTDGVKREYTFWYQDAYIYVKPGNWYTGEDYMIHFEKRRVDD